MTDEIEPHIFKKYEILKKLGKGAYGIVWKAICKKTKKVYALKKVFEAFYNPTDAQRTFREVMFLQNIDHDNIIKLIKVIKADNNRDLYLVFDYMETDLHAVIKANILKEIHKKFIIYQILKSLKYIHSGELIHRDLKPSNILINTECHIKLADFGWARSVANYDDEGDLIMTEYVATRWYRAPEIILGSNKYSKVVDIWSVGCILGELIIGQPIFPGKSTLNQIEQIFELLGKPKAEDIVSIESENIENIIKSINIKKKKNFAQFFKNANTECLDFIKKCLEINPLKRISAEEALNHPYIKEFRKKEEEITLSSAITISLNDNTKLSIKEYRENIYKDIIKKNKEKRKQFKKNYLKSIGWNNYEFNYNKNEIFKKIIKPPQKLKNTNTNTLAKKNNNTDNKKNTKTNDIKNYYSNLISSKKNNKKKTKVKTDYSSYLNSYYSKFKSETKKK